MSGEAPPPGRSVQQLTAFLQRRQLFQPAPTLPTGDAEVATQPIESDAQNIQPKAIPCLASQSDDNQMPDHGTRLSLAETSSFTLSETSASDDDDIVVPNPFPCFKNPPLDSWVAYESQVTGGDSQIQNTQSRRTQTLGRHGYENVEIEPVPRRHSSGTMPSYENVSIPTTTELLDKVLQDPFESEDTSTSREMHPGLPRDAEAELSENDMVTPMMSEQLPSVAPSRGRSIKDALEVAMGERLSLRSGSEGSGSEPAQIMEQHEENVFLDNGFDSYSDGDFDDSEFDDLDAEEGEDSISLRSSVSSQFSSRRWSGSQHSAEGDRDPLYCILRELVHTEQAYVDRLHLLVRVFLLNVKILNKVQDPPVLPPNVMRQVFSNLEVIYDFHACNFLPEVKQRMRSWWEHKRLGDILRPLMPFMKLYKEYMENYQAAMAAIDTWSKKSAVFNAIVQEIERLPECGRLTVKQHMLDLVHRVPKYRALLKDYLDLLPDDSDEIKDMQESLKTVSDTASELERAMGKDDRMKALAALQQKLVGFPNVVKSTRELVKEAKIQTISPRTAKKHDRHIFLCNDLLLLCTTASLSGRYKVLATLHVDGMQVQAGGNLEEPHAFYVRCQKQALEFCASNAETMQEWIQMFDKTIEEFTVWKLSGQQMPKSKPSIKEEEIGLRAPTMVHSPSVSMCMLCGNGFGALKRRHHCRGCGHVVCSKCCTQRAPLEYESLREGKVCDDCYLTLRRRHLDQDKARWSKQHVGGSDPAVQAGFLHISSNRGLTWTRLWFTLHHNNILYSFKAQQDIAALSSLPLQGCDVRLTQKKDRVHKATMFRLQRGKKIYYFQTETPDAASKWVDILRDAISCTDKESSA